jgi:hypothetical protein
MNHGRAALYLQIPAEYCRSFGGLRWAHYGEAIEFLEGPTAGRTFAFAGEVAAFLEGLGSAGSSLPGFGFVLHLLYLVGLGDRAARHGERRALCVERIASPFRSLGCPLRNAGALCSWLIREAPRAADPPDVSELQEILTGGSWVPQMVLSHPLLGVMDQAEEPGLEAAELEELVYRSANALSDDEIRHWLRHGRGPGRSDVEPPLPPQPRSLAETLAELEQSPRLAGIGRLVSRLEAAISLPPRRLAWSELQDGGYSDIATKGAPEQILPIQFALEGEEFLRRFAERELLYFYREEPRVPTTEEIVILLDQGVRTWGDVRLGLVGAALAVARQAERRGIAIKLAVTSDDVQVVDPATAAPVALAELLAASDLSPHPGESLERLRSVPSASRRDIILLTHPRSLLGAEVAAAARALADEVGARLFAISIDASGRLELAELRRGLPVVLARSRIDLVPPESPAPARPPVADLADRPILMVWKGRFESIGFPFHTGVLDPFETNSHAIAASFDFDESGERILIVGRHGLLFSCRIDGSEAEVIPRPRVDNTVLIFRRPPLGVAGGFVLEGFSNQRRFLAHYDFTGRTCRLHEVEGTQGELSWLYYRDLHAVAGLPVDRNRHAVAIDLGETGVAAPKSSRANRAATRASAGIRPYPLTTSSVWTSPSLSWPDPPPSASIRLDAISGTLHFDRETESGLSLTPLVDGKPALQGSRLVRAVQGGDVVALLVVGAADPVLYFLSVSRGTVVGLFPLPAQAGGTMFAMSRDGERFARPLDHRQSSANSGRLEVREVPGDQPPILVTPKENLWIHFASLGRSCLLIREFDLSGPRRSQISWLVRWDQDGLLHAMRLGDSSVIEIPPVTPAPPKPLPAMHLGDSSVMEQYGGVVAVSRSVPSGNHGQGYDPERFVQMIESRGLRILIDRYNHVVVLGRGGELICVMFVSFHEFAAWLPDGTVFGDRRLIGGEPTPGGGQRIAAALKRAEQGGGSSS